MRAELTRNEQERGDNLAIFRQTSGENTRQANSELLNVTFADSWTESLVDLESSRPTISLQGPS